MSENMDSKKISVSGWGAVSPAGWNAAALCVAVIEGKGLPICVEKDARSVPPVEKGILPRSPRLRRTSPIGKFLVAAAVEALGAERVEAIKAGDLNIHIIVNVLNGSVIFSTRFFSEVLQDPSTASPLIFPETVFNAPSSHVAAVIGSTGSNETIVGDSAQFLASLETAALRLLDGECDGCLVACAEEFHWITQIARRLYDRDAVISEGAAAVYLEKTSGPARVELDAVTDPFFPGETEQRESSIRQAREQIAPVGDETLIDSTHDFGKTSVFEKNVWQDWTGQRYQPTQILGDGLAAASGWNTVLACELISRARAQSAIVSAVGGNQQAVCARLIAG